METDSQKEMATEANKILQADVTDDVKSSEQQTQQDSKKRVKHEDHHVNRKYKLFSNHSSYGDSPHTNTSF